MNVSSSMVEHHITPLLCACHISPCLIQSMIPPQPLNSLELYWYGFRSLHQLWQILCLPLGAISPNLNMSSDSSTSLQNWLLTLHLFQYPIKLTNLPLQNRHPTIDKVDRQLDTRQGHCLFRGGRLVLLNMVLTALPLYIMYFLYTKMDYQSNWSDSKSLLLKTWPFD